ncbi:SCP2 sterol-binding domain-containing protein [Endozoicomonas sp. Mp262]|uniref:ubiquinone anaerobic biosynthesis accessory factor UbiT n=1 Tax=Endozoicomonas sp. Mp262 TaxID=2919499 RepID=UPI0021D7DE0F
MVKMLPPVPDPSILGLPIKLLPTTVIAAPIERLINRLFKVPVEEGDFDFLEDRWLKIHFSDINFNIHLGFDGTRLNIVEPRPCDVEFRGTIPAFISLATRKEDPDTLFFQRKLMIEGDTELGLGIKNLLDSLEMEQLPAEIRAILTLSNKVQSGLSKLIH